MSKLFTEEKYNVLYQALEECARQDRLSEERWITWQSDITLVSHLVDKLEELGYIIVKK